MKHIYTRKIEKDFVRIKRLSIQSQTEANLTYNMFEGAILKINNKHGILKRSELYEIVMIESAIVWLLPMLDWDNDFNQVIIIYNQNTENAFAEDKKNETIKEAKDDKDFRVITRELRIRRGQNKLRENLFYLYEGKCCLTRFGIKELLHACHIIPHSHSGINSTSNALLFRADIHDLFDANLIGINPSTLQAVPDRILQETEYNKLNDIKICDRIDGKTPDINALKYRWDIFNSRK